MKEQYTVMELNLEDGTEYEVEILDNLGDAQQNAKDYNEMAKLDGQRRAMALGLTTEECIRKMYYIR